MEIHIDRAWKKPLYTISRVYIDGVRLGDGRRWCNALEDTDRGLTDRMTADEIQCIKVYGNTAIPSGNYEVQMSWSPRFGRMMPLVVGVKGFSGVRMHSGNSPGDTLGCILFGANDKPGWISDSRYWTAIVQRRIEQAMKKGEKVWLRVGK